MRGERDWDTDWSLWPEHLVRGDVNKLPKKVWDKMTPEQRLAWIRWKEEWNEGLAEEKRANRRHRHGY